MRRAWPRVLRAGAGPGDEDGGTWHASQAGTSPHVDELTADGTGDAAALPRLSSPQPLGELDAADGDGGGDSDGPQAYVVTEAAFKDEDAEEHRDGSSPMDE